MEGLQWNRLSSGCVGWVWLTGFVLVSRSNIVELFISYNVFLVDVMMLLGRSIPALSRQVVARTCLESPLHTSSGCWAAVGLLASSQLVVVKLHFLEILPSANLFGNDRFSLPQQGEISGSHGGEFEVVFCDVAPCSVAGRNLCKFQRCVLPQPSLLMEAVSILYLCVSHDFHNKQRLFP
jgi:hypothetical protein